MCVSGGNKCSFFEKFAVLCLLETPVLRFALLAYYRQYLSHKKQNLFVQSHKAANFGDKSLKIIGSQIWRLLSEKIKSVTNLVNFKNSRNPRYMCHLRLFKNENAENKPWKSFITYTTSKFIFIQFYIYFGNLNVLVNEIWG